MASPSNTQSKKGSRRRNTSSSSNPQTSNLCPNPSISRPVFDQGPIYSNQSQYFVQIRPMCNMNLSKRAKTSTTTNTSQSQSSDARNAEEEDFFQPAPVPMGRDAAKAAKRKLKGVAVDAVQQQVDAVNESVSKLETQLSSLSSVYRDSTGWDKEKFAELKDMHAERMRVKAMKWFLKDTTRMTPEQLKAFEATRDELVAKYLKR